VPVAAAVAVAREDLGNTILSKSSFLPVEGGVHGSDCCSISVSARGISHAMIKFGMLLALLSNSNIC
jgi:hypothetical protein